MSKHTTMPPHSRAVVLGGGGVPGLAWMIGFLHGAEHAGITLADADLVLGTSAGAVAATLLRTPGATATAYQRLTETDHLPYEAAAPAGSTGFAEALPGILTLAADSNAYVQALINLSNTISADEGTAIARLRTMHERTGTTQWPDADLRITALSLRDAGRHVLTRHSGIDLLTALAASCAVPGVWPPVQASNGDRYADAGPLSDTHADLAANAEQVVVLQPVPNLQGDLAAEVSVLRRALLITPDSIPSASEGDPRPVSARAGFQQAGRYSDRLRTYWATA